MDEQFIGRIYRSIILIWIIAVTWALAFQKFWIAVNITQGVLAGTLIIASNGWVASQLFKQSVHKPARLFAKIWLIKYPAMIVLLYLLVRWNKFNALAFCGGVALVYLAIVLKALGIMLVEQIGKDRNEEDKIPGSAHRS